jgi:hypothetical protein
LEYLGNAVVDASGHWFNAFTGATAGEKLVATATDIFGNTSEFSPNSDIVAGIEDLNEGNAFVNVFPNPASTECFLEYSVKDPQFITASLYAVDGRLVSTLFAETLPPTGSYKKINLQEFPDGIYFLNLRGNNFTKNCKLIISK